MSDRDSAEAKIMVSLAGAWRLVAIELPQTDGTIKRSDVTGLLVFTDDGHTAVQVRYLESSAADNAYSKGGYEASFGTIEIDPAANIFVYRVESALIADLVEQNLSRSYRFEGDQLFLSSTRDDEKWRVIWRRA